MTLYVFFFFFSSRRRHTRCLSDWSSDVCSSDLPRAHDQVTGAGRDGNESRQEAAAGPAVPATREEWGEPADVARQRDGGVEAEPEEQRAAVVLVAKLLQTRDGPLVVARQPRVDVIDDEQPAGAVECQRAAAHQPLEPAGVNGKLVVRTEAPDAATVFLAEEQLVCARRDGETSERRRPRVRKGNAHPRLTRQIDRERASEIDAVQLGGGVTAGDEPENEERAAVERELQGSRHAGGDDLESRPRLETARARGDGQGADEQAGAPGDRPRG